MTTPDAHPDLIAWVSGLGAGATRAPLVSSDAVEDDVTTHLRRCEACREEAAALRSLRRSLRASEESHLSIEKLLEIEAAGEGASRGDDSAGRHLAQCGECRADLEALVRAGRTRPGHEAERSPAPERAGGSRARLAWAAAAAALVLIAGLAFLKFRPPHLPDESNPPPEEFVLFAAPSRGGGPRLLSGGQSATVRVVLPFGSEGGSYEARLERPDGSIVTAAQARVLRDGELLETRIDVPAAPGPYRLALLPKSGGEPIVYPIHVVAGPGTSLPQR